MQSFKKIAIVLLLSIMISPLVGLSQDTTLKEEGLNFTLSDAIVRNHFDYKAILQRIKEDTSFYKAFKTLRTIGYSSYNHIEMKNKEGRMLASLDSKTRQNHMGDCRTMDVLQETITGDLRKADGSYNYMTPSLYASLFFTKGQICGETSVVAGKKRVVSGTGIEKAKEQLKMLFFNPG